ncbi:MAG: hypothetical protein ACJ77O_09765 [Chloroflexota bacterium]
MSDDEDDILVREWMGKGPEGSWLAAEKLPSERFETVVLLRSNQVTATTAISAALSRLGRLISTEHDGVEVKVAGVVGGGFMNWNPTVLKVRIAPSEEGQCLATFTGTSKQGRITQGTSEKAVRRVLKAHELAPIRLPTPEDHVVTTRSGPRPPPARPR